MSAKISSSLEIEGFRAFEHLTIERWEHCHVGSTLSDAESRRVVDARQ